MILSGLVVSTLLWANPLNPYVWIVLAVTLGFGFVGFYDDYLKVTKQSHSGFAGKLRLLIEAVIALAACYALVRLGRRIAVLGDMLELGPDGAELHATLSNAVLENAVDLVYCAGPLMKALWDALPSERRGGYAENSAALEPEVLKAITAADAVMVKGSLGSRMGRIVKALQRRSVQAEQALG